MFLTKKILTAIAMPPLSLLIIVCIGLWVGRRLPRRGFAIIAFALTILTALSLPIVSHVLKKSLEGTAPISADHLARAQAIVILGGGIYRNAPEYGGDTIGRSSLERTRYGLHLHRQTGLPLLVSGGAPFGGLPEADAMRNTIEHEFKEVVHWTENRSRDTSENAQYSAALLKQEGITHIALVSHVWHLPRAVAYFEREGLVAFPAPTQFTPGIAFSFLHFLPTSGALNASTQALREWLGLGVEKISRLAIPTTRFALHAQ